MAEDGDGFLTRWSRRKLLARTGKPVPQSDSIEQDTGAVAGSGPNAETFPPGDAEATAALPAPAPSQEEEIPLEDLPPIESIDAGTDLAPWLRRKVPEMWKRAALRRVWAADPAIATYIGPVENGWDWNAPGGVPGFGPLNAADDVAALLAQAIGARREEETVAADGQDPAADGCPLPPDADPQGGHQSAADYAMDEPEARPVEDRHDDRQASEAAPLGETQVQHGVSETGSAGQGGMAAAGRFATPQLRRRGGGALPV